MKDRDKARTFGQDLMKGENNKFGKKRAPGNLTWVQGRTDGKELDPVSKKILKGGARIRSNTAASANAMQYAGGFEDAATGTSGTSIFDPVLCELVYRWFCPPTGHVLDPFAGGSVRGIVAGVLKRSYTGIDLRPEQVKANEVQARRILKKGHGKVKWIVGDSVNVVDLAPREYDLVFSCPPYADLERYSDDPRDLSTMKYADFLDVYRTIVDKSTRAIQRKQPRIVVPWKSPCPKNWLAKTQRKWVNVKNRC